MSLFLDYLREHRAVFDALEGLDADICAAAKIMSTTLASGGKALFCGNGGSAADSQHIAAELTGRFIADRRPLAGLALTVDTSALTSIANDYSFDDVFDRQVRGLGRAGDCLIGISTSGNSTNVLKAFESARAMSIATIGLLGRDGGKLRPLCDVAIVVASQTTARIQEAHSLIGHALCGQIELDLGLTSVAA